MKLVKLRDRQGAREIYLVSRPVFEAMRRMVNAASGDENLLAAINDVEKSSPIPADDPSAIEQALQDFPAGTDPAEDELKERLDL